MTQENHVAGHGYTSVQDGRKHSCCSIGVLAHFASEYRQPDNLEIEPEGVMTDVIEITFHAPNHLFQRVSLAAESVHLGPTGNSWLDLVAQHVLEN